MQIPIRGIDTLSKRIKEVDKELKLKDFVVSSKKYPEIHKPRVKDNDSFLNNRKIEVGKEKKTQRPASSCSKIQTLDPKVQIVKKPQQIVPMKIDWFMNKTQDLMLEVNEVIGEGGFGEVLKGVDKVTGDEVALKFFDKRKTKDSSQRKLFQKEVDLLEKLDHPNIIKIRRLAQNVNKVYIVMDYWGKNNLAQFINSFSLNFHEMKKIMKDILDAIRYLHSKDIYHRDIKAENIMVKKEGSQVQACLIDFGLAVHCEKTSCQCGYCGTMSYSSPEMIDEQAYFCGPNDIWQIGVLFYFLLKKEFPFGSKKEFIRW